MSKRTLLNNVSATIVFIASLLFFGLHNAAYAQTYHYTITGGENHFPFDGTVVSGNKCQWLYKPSDFNITPPKNTTISTIYVRMARTMTEASYADFTIKLGNSTLKQLASGTWNELTTVFKGDLVTEPTSSGKFCAFTLQTPFCYTGGNLILEISQSSKTAPAMIVYQGNPGGTRRLYGTTESRSSMGADGTCLSFGFDGSPTNCVGANTTAAGSTTTVPLVKSENGLKSALAVQGISNWNGSINLYPNPTGGRFTISASWTEANIGKHVFVDVLNTLGQLVYRKEVIPVSAAWQAEVRLSDETPGGQYLVRISTDEMRYTSHFVLVR